MTASSASSPPSSPGVPGNPPVTAAVERVRYREHALLTAADLQAEQQYRIAMRRRHDIGLHVWGIVEGLGLAVQQGELVVEPGAAVDGYGRELIVPARIVVAAEVLNRLGDGVAV